MTRVLSVSSSRADIGILAPVWRALADMDSVELHIFKTGAHLAQESGFDTIVPTRAAVHSGGDDPGGREPVTAAEAMAAILADASRAIVETDPDIVLAVGDRIDMVPAALATVPLNVPLAHLHGGEQTLGAVDDLLRHAMTKLAHLHFAASEDAAGRILRMGEEPWRVHLTGAPGLDTLKAAKVLTADEFAQAVGLPTIEGLRLVAVHPETNSEDPAKPLNAVLAALGRVAGPILFTAPNSDPGGDAIRAEIEAFADKLPDAAFIETLGPSLFPSALRHAAVMLGNSSAGIVEAGLFALPAINVGRRQEARLRGPNVHDCGATANEVAKLLRTAPVRPQSRPSECATPYGDGRSGPRIAERLRDLPERRRLLRKVFHDIDADAPDRIKMAGAGQ